MDYITPSPFRKKPTGQKPYARAWKEKWWPIVWKTAVFLAAAGLLVVAGTFAYFAKDLPSPGKVNAREIAESTKIFDRTGEHLLYDIHGEEKRTIIPFSEMPASVKLSTIALEDQDFYSHHGIKFSSILRAVFKDVVERSAAQGGSTITQQFVKNSLLTTEKTYTRKIKEVILSVEMEQKFSKDEILEMYLNEIPYGSNAYGIEAAAQTFFSKNARDLTLSEAAFLAALPKAPSYYSPFGSHTDELKARQEAAIRKMTDIGYISHQEADAAVSDDIFSRLRPRIDNINAPHFVMYIREYLEEKYGQDTVERAGLKVYTTLDWEKQQLAEKVVREGAQKNMRSWNAENAALVAMDPNTGQILAMVGSRNFFDEEIDGQVNVAVRDRQPGSSIKPFVYLAAFTKGYSPETMLFDVATNFGPDGSDKDYEPQNYTGTFSGPLHIKEALGRSLNVPAVKVLYLVGVKNAIAMAKDLGITTLNDPNRYGLALVLGGGEVKLLDHTAAYATLATGGVKREKTGILRIEDAKGAVLEQYKDGAGVRVVEEKFVAALDEIISNNIYRAPAFGENNPLRFDSRAVAAKTGTTNDFHDGWTMGYTPSLAVGVWTGNNDNSPMRPGADGSVVAAPIWRAFMEETTKNMQNESFPKYDPEEFKTDKDMLDGELEEKKNVKVCEIPGKDSEYCLANKYCTDKDEKKRDFVAAHTILYYVDRNDPLGEKPKDPENDPQFKEWEKGVRKYYKDEKGVIFGDIPKDDCREGDFSKYKPSVSLSVPSSIHSQTLSIAARADAPYGVEKIEIFVDGDKAGETSSESYSADYTVPASKNNSTLSVEARLKDKNGNETSQTASVSAVF